MQIKEIHALVQDDFQAVDALIHQEMHSGVPLVESIASHIIDSGGKRTRPLLVLLLARASGFRSEKAVVLATIMEFLHTATLLHDDVVDTSMLRRGSATANARWGNAPSVLVGDFLYSRAFQMMIRLQNTTVLEVLADATNYIAEGEVLQLSNCRNPDISEQTYMRVITAKTAKLFEAAAESLAVLAGTEDDTRKAMAAYGLELGIAFQLTDDVLDFAGDPETMGKNVGDDLAEGKPTLPLLEAIRLSDESIANRLRMTIRKGDVEALEFVAESVRGSGALDSVQTKARRHADRAEKHLDQHLESSPFRSALSALAHLAANRSY